MKKFRRARSILSLTYYRWFIVIRYFFIIKFNKFINFQNLRKLTEFKNEWSYSIISSGFYLGDKFNLDRQELEYLINDIDQYSEVGHQKQTKKFFRVVDLNNKTIQYIINCLLKRDSEFIDFANAYCMGDALIHSAQYVRSNFESDDLKSSQLYHRDYASTATFKIFIYLSDVLNEDHGPFSFLKKHKESLYKRIRYYSFHKPLSWENSVPQGLKKKVMGNKGKVFFVDTHKLYHCGSRIKRDSSERRVIILTFRFKKIMSGPEKWENWVPMPLNAFKNSTL